MSDNLEKYKKKRDFSKTDEPMGSEAQGMGNLRFVVHYHIARNEHYDFRLEWNGVLKSFALPKGPSLNPNDKRLAIEVEDHPIEYRDFEGVIPKGEYGGGTVMIWDEGIYEPELFTSSTIKFELFGERLKGKWVLVYMKENQWLLIKETDKHSKKSVGISKFKKSVRTGRTMKEIEKTSN